MRPLYEYVPFVIAAILIVGALILTIGIVHSESGEECNFRGASILRSVNSIEDINNGLFSSGTINEKTLLFEDGLVASFKKWQLRGVELVIGNRYGIVRCINNGGKIWYEIGSSQYVEKDALVAKSVGGEGK